MPTETKLVHFTLGENAGALLATIAQEHLIYNHDIKKAVETITQSLIGVPTKIAMQILKGDIVLHVSADGREFLAGPYDPTIHSKIFSRLDCAAFAMRKYKEITNTGKSLPAIIDMYTNRVRYRGHINVDVSYESILDLVGGDESSVLREIMDNDEIGGIERLILASKAFLDTASRDMAIIHFMKTTWPEEFEEIKDNLEYRINADAAKDWVMRVAESLSGLFNSEYIIRSDNPSVKAFIDASIAIDEVIEKGIEPVNIMDNYSAGWLSPEGDYYALNGEIANMLHNQIADALLKKGIIPNTEENEGNPDNWLQREGWVRIHGNEINFEAHMNVRINHGENKYMTDKQVDMITEYCRMHHNQIVKIFFQPVSALSFQRMAKNDPAQLYGKYLNW